MPEKQRFSLKFTEMLIRVTEMKNGFSGMQVKGSTGKTCSVPLSFKSTNIAEQT